MEQQPRTRLTGVDLARAVALLGMMAVHVFPPQTADGGTPWVFTVFSGRSAALFAVLAGVGLALGAPRAGARASIARRASIVAVVGLLLGELPSGVAVILAYYALLFLLALPVLGRSARALAALSLACAVVVPVLLFVARDGLPRADANPSWLLLFQAPGALLSTLLVTGYYPVLAWSAYLLAGLAVGRLALGERRTAVGLLVGGALLAAGASAVSWLLLGPGGGRDAIARTVDLEPGQSVSDVVDGNQFGDVPTTTGWWLAVDSPHSTTPLDLLHTTGTSLAVLGAALLLARALRPALLAPVTAAGAMTLTLYAVHVVVLSVTDGDDPARLYWAQVVAFSAFALVWARAVGRGPLEALAHLVARGLRR
ncbi:MAG: hypothetical protein JWN57_1098 [Frankiales bacterium]|nr:hypothetical protein [Frankiales bacterium]